MDNAYITHRFYPGPDNISIKRLTIKDVYEIQRALKIASMSIPTEECCILMQKIELFLETHQDELNQ